MAGAESWLITGDNQFGKTGRTCYSCGSNPLPVTPLRRVFRQLMLACRVTRPHDTAGFFKTYTMKVICIKKPVKSDLHLSGVSRPEVGDIDTVCHSETVDEHLYYCLERFGMNYGFLAELFSPWSDVDETELVETEEAVF